MSDRTANASHAKGAMGGHEQRMQTDKGIAERDAELEQLARYYEGLGEFVTAAEYREQKVGK